MSKSNNKTTKPKKAWKNKTPLQKGATVANWLSFILMGIGILLLIINCIMAAAVDKILLSWNICWIIFASGFAVGVLWFIFVMIMLNVFHKR